MVYRRFVTHSLHVKERYAPQLLAMDGDLELIETEIERHSQELELLRRHVKQLTARVSAAGRTGDPGPMGPPGCQ